MTNLTNLSSLTSNLVNSTKPNTKKFISESDVDKYLIDKYKKTDNNNNNNTNTNSINTSSNNRQILQSALTSNDATKFLTGITDKTFSNFTNFTQQLKRPPKTGEISIFKAEKISLDPYKISGISNKKATFPNKSEDFSMLVVNTEQANPYVLMKKTSNGN